MSTLRDLGEFPFIRSITANLPTSPEVLVGPGDDCAVLRFGDRVMLLTCDLSVEDVHFQRGAAKPRDVGWKAVAAGLSDIAAMGGEPRFVVTSVAAPADQDADELSEVCKGIADAAGHCGAMVVGGDVTRSPGGIVVDITVVGEAPEGRYVTRDGTLPGDVLAVTGWPGRSAAGLDAITLGLELPRLVEAHYRPEPRIAAGKWLANQETVHAMIDLSDGVVQDAGHLCEHSGLGLGMTSASVAVDPELVDVCIHSHKSLQDYVFTGGEAYELAFAIDGERFGPILEAFRQEFQLPVTVLGRFSDDFTGILIDGAPPENPGYEHFT